MTVVHVQMKCWMTLLCSGNCGMLKRGGGSCRVKLQNLTSAGILAMLDTLQPLPPPPAFFVSCLISTFSLHCLFCLLLPHTPHNKNTSIFLLKQTPSAANIYNLYNTETYYTYVLAPTHANSFDCMCRRLSTACTTWKTSWSFGNVCAYLPPPCSFPCK